jgi:hypothetical protein
VIQDFIMTDKVIDLGCGPNKVEGAYGVDKHPYPGVDQPFDLDVTPWPLDANTYTHIYARHVIEHVSDIPALLNEIHRIASDNAQVTIITPHYSSANSWDDPTHRWHLSCKWHAPFTDDQYMTQQIGDFEHISTTLQFSRRSLRSVVPRVMIALAGRDWWEKHYAFIYRARNMTTELKVHKSDVLAS